MKERFRTWLLAGMLALTGSAQALYLATTWASTEVKAAACTQNARAALQLAGLGQGLSVSGDSIYGNSAEYIATVRCLTGEQILFVAVAGPNPQQSQTYAQTVRQVFLSIKPSGAQ